MKRTFLLGSLFLRVSSVYGAAAHGDLIMEGRRRNEEAYERQMEERGWKTDKLLQDKKADSSHDNDKNLKAAKPKSS
jgi:hypothetical protein